MPMDPQPQGLRKLHEGGRAGPSSQQAGRALEEQPLGQNSTPAAGPPGLLPGGMGAWRPEQATPPFRAREQELEAIGHGSGGPHAPSRTAHGAASGTRGTRSRGPVLLGPQRQHPPVPVPVGSPPWICRKSTPVRSPTLSPHLPACTPSCCWRQWGLPGLPHKLHVASWAGAQEDPRGPGGHPPKGQHPPWGGPRTRVRGSQLTTKLRMDRWKTVPL